MIKNLLLPFLGILFTMNVFAQTNKTNLVVFSEDGDKFYLVINGIRQNMKSETNVRVTDLTTENFSFTIVFEDTKIPAIKKTQSLPFGNEYTYRITTKKGKKAMKYFGETALTAPSNNTGSTTIVYHATEDVPVTTSTVGTSTSGNTTGVSTNVNSSGTGVSTNVNVGGGTNESTTTTTTTSTTTTGGTANGTNGIGMNVDIKDNTDAGGGNVSTGVNVGGVGMNIDINVSENGANINMGGTGMNTGVNTTGTAGTVGTSTTGNTTSGTNVSGSTTTTFSSTTTTTTTTSTSGGTGISTNANVGGTGVTTSTNVTGTGINTGTNVSGNTTASGTSTYTGTSNYMCGAAMGSTDFASAKKSIESKDFEDSKFTVAKQVTKNNCLSAEQIKEVMGIFDFEATKLDYAKYAYDFCYDKNNYYKLNDAFDFESSVDDLNTYIEKK